jgi:hypothetical protein
MDPLMFALIWTQDPPRRRPDPSADGRHRWPVTRRGRRRTRGTSAGGTALQGARSVALRLPGIDGAGRARRPTKPAGSSELDDLTPAEVEADHDRRHSRSDAA